METITLFFLLLGLITVFTIDTVQKRRKYLNEGN